jgi:hypothetical protein
MVEYPIPMHTTTSEIIKLITNAKTKRERTNALKIANAVATASKDRAQRDLIEQIIATVSR